MKKQTLDLIKALPALLGALATAYISTYAGVALTMLWDMWEVAGVVEYKTGALFVGFWVCAIIVSYALFARFARAFKARFGKTASKSLDDQAVDTFAETMKAKLAEKRKAGLGGWDNPVVCPASLLLSRMRQQANRRPEDLDPIDVANYAMMTWHRGMKK